MARPLRIEFEGAWYHVINRGAARREVFASDLQRRRFLELLGALTDRFRIETHAYCLMDNHYHLLLHTPLGNLGRGMRHLDGVYTQFFNRDQERDGALFRGRYKAILVDADEYLLHLSSYIHRNPLEAGLVDRLEDYAWSSHAAYVGRTAAPPWLRREMVYSMLGGKAKRYQSFAAKGLNKDLAQFYGRKAVFPILGDDNFKQQVLERHGCDDSEITERNRVHEPASLDKIIAVVATTLDCDQQQIYQSIRGRQNLARMLAVHFAHCAGQLTYREIAEALGMNHYSAVASSIRRLERLCRETKQVRQLLQTIRQNIAQK
ncbi:MAG: transposase [Wenzhouxiangellaceae bacterium]|nr:transposase [Wenzhouxiangellaceae bacterium]